MYVVGDGLSMKFSDGTEIFDPDDLADIGIVDNETWRLFDDDMGDDVSYDDTFLQFAIDVIQDNSFCACFADYGIDEDTSLESVFDTLLDKNLINDTLESMHENGDIRLLHEFDDDGNETMQVHEDLDLDIQQDNTNNTQKLLHTYIREWVDCVVIDNYILECETDYSNNGVEMQPSVYRINPDGSISFFNVDYDELTDSEYEAIISKIITKDNSVLDLIEPMLKHEKNFGSFEEFCSEQGPKWGWESFEEFVEDHPNLF